MNPYLRSFLIVWACMLIGMVCMPLGLAGVLLAAAFGYLR